MPTADGCRSRRQRLLDRLRPTTPIVLADPLNLRYFANFHVDAISQHADYGGLLVIRPDGHATLHHDSKMPKSVELAHADVRNPISWYTGQEPEPCPRRMLLRPVLEAAGGRIHDSLADPQAPKLFEIVGELRRRKDPDEVEQLRACMRASEAGHAWGRANIAPGMTELDFYLGVAAACQRQVGQMAVVYGDFTVTTGSKRGGAPTTHKLEAGQTVIVDFSVIVQGYRSDYTNTLIVGGQPTAEQKRLFDLSVQALAAGEAKLKAGVTCQSVYDAMRGVFEAAGEADHFTTHGGHGLGISHPEPPYIVRHSNETLVEGDVVTLEPGLYAGNIGIRVENDYLITATGCERLSNHVISPS